MLKGHVLLLYYPFARFHVESGKTQFLFSKNDRYSFDLKTDGKNSSQISNTAEGLDLQLIPANCLANPPVLKDEKTSSEKSQ